MLPPYSLNLQVVPLPIFKSSMLVPTVGMVERMPSQLGSEMVVLEEAPLLGLLLMLVLEVSFLRSSVLPVPSAPSIRHSLLPAIFN